MHQHNPTSIFHLDSRVQSSREDFPYSPRRASVSLLTYFIWTPVCIKKDAMESLFPSTFALCDISYHHNFPMSNLFSHLPECLRLINSHLCVILFSMCVIYVPIPAVFLHFLFSMHYTHTADTPFPSPIRQNLFQPAAPSHLARNRVAGTGVWMPYYPC